MSKRAVSYIKPEEPSFLKKLKKEAGYQEGPTVDTKREALGPVEDLSDGEEEKPQVVVLNEGDLTAEQAAQEKLLQEKKATEAPADLNTRVIFKAPTKKATTEENPSSVETKISNRGGKQKKQLNKDPKNTTTPRRNLKSKALLSFDDEEEEGDN